MNERIKELLKQSCGFEYDEDGNELILVSKDLAKFAELIVRDCMLICEDVMKKDNSALGCWSEIKRKFRS